MKHQPCHSPVRGGVTKTMNRQTSRVKWGTWRRRYKDSRHVASKVKPPQAPARATYLESLHSKLHIPLCTQLDTLRVIQIASPCTGRPLPGGGRWAFHYKINRRRRTTKSDSKFVRQSSILTASICRHYESLFVCSLSSLEWPDQDKVLNQHKQLL